MSDSNESTGANAPVNEAEALLKLVVDSGYGHAVIEEAIRLLKRKIANVDLQHPAVKELLKAHLLAVGSPSAVGKFFSFELLCRIDEETVTDVAIEICRMLAGLELKPDRAYVMERELLSWLGSHDVHSCLPPLAIIASRKAGEISRAAAKAAVAIVGSRKKSDIQDALKALDIAEAEPSGELAQAIISAFNRRRRAPHEEAQVRFEEDHQDTLSLDDSIEVPGETSTRAVLRPELRRERENRLRAILRESGRNPEECCNCGLVGVTKIGHIIPQDRGGSDRAGNLTSFCPQCWRKFVANRRNSSSVRRRLETISSNQLGLFDPPKEIP